MSAEDKPEDRKSIFRTFVTSPRAGWRAVRNLAAEFWNDHDFWIHTLAVKGGASAIAIAGGVAVSHVVALPFLLAAGGIALCGAVIALGVYGVVAGASEAWSKLREIYARARGEEPPLAPAEDRVTFAQKMKEKPLVRAFLQNKTVQKILASQAWKTSRKFAQKEQDMILGGFAVGGSFVNMAIGITMLVTQIAVLPVIAVGSLFTIASAGAIGAIAAGGVALFISVRSLFERTRARKAASNSAAQETQETASAPTQEAGGRGPESENRAGLAQEFDAVRKPGAVQAPPVEDGKPPQPGRPSSPAP